MGGSSFPAVGSRRAKVRASTVIVRHAFATSRFGDAGARRFVDAASPELRMLVSLGKRRDDWVEFALFLEATELADRLFGRGDLALAWEMGRFAAEHNLGVWKSLLMKVMRPSTVLSIAAGLWSHHYDSGRLVARSQGGTGVHLTLSDFATPHRAHCLSVAGWAERTIELSGSKRVRIAEDRCRTRGAEACEFSLSWE